MHTEAHTHRGHILASCALGAGVALPRRDVSSGPRSPAAQALGVVMWAFRENSLRFRLFCFLVVQKLPLGTPPIWGRLGWVQSEGGPRHLPTCPRLARLQGHFNISTQCALPPSPPRPLPAPDPAGPAFALGKTVTIWLAEQIFSRGFW